MILKSETYNFHRLDLTRQAGFVVTIYDEGGLRLAATMPFATPAEAFAEARKIVDNKVTIIGGAIANSQPRYYVPAPDYVAYPGYGAPPPVACPGGYWSRRPIAFDAYGNPVGWSRPRFVCP